LLAVSIIIELILRPTEANRREATFQAEANHLMATFQAEAITNRAEVFYPLIIYFGIVNSLS
jgi:hypothetical protein